MDKPIQPNNNSCTVGTQMEIPDHLKKYIDDKLFETAMTPAKVDNVNNSERLEFLGDAVLGFIVSEHLYKKHEHASPGELTKLKELIGKVLS